MRNETIVNLYVWIWDETGAVYVGRMTCEHQYALDLLARNRNLAVSQYADCYRRSN